MSVGPPLAAAKKMGRQSTADAFLAYKLKVDVGQLVTFVPTGFHLVDFPKKGDDRFPLIIPYGAEVAGADDAAGTTPVSTSSRSALTWSASPPRPPRSAARTTYAGAQIVESRPHHREVRR